MSSAQRPWGPKYAGDTVRRVADWTDRLDAGDTVVDVEIISATGNLTATEATTDGVRTTLWVGGGDSSEAGRLSGVVTLLATTAGGEKLTAKIPQPILPDA